MPAYRLLTEDGSDLGLFRSKMRYEPGKKIYRVTGEIFRVVRFVQAMDGDEEIDGFLIVKLLTGGTSIIGHGERAPPSDR